MKLLLFLIFLAISGGGQPAQAHDGRLGIIMQSLRLETLNRRLGEWTMLRQIEKRCQAELRGEKVPVHCLRLLALQPQRDYARWRAIVAHLCVRAVTKINEVSEIRPLLSQLHWDKDCLGAAKKRKDRLQYMHPEMFTSEFTSFPDDSHL